MRLNVSLLKCPVVNRAGRLRMLMGYLRRLASGPVVMVGDRPETDLATGKAEGWTTVLALTGVTTDASEVPEVFRPDHVIDSIADLPGLLGV